MSLLSAVVRPEASPVPKQPDWGKYEFSFWLHETHPGSEMMRGNLMYHAENRTIQIRTEDGDGGETRLLGETGKNTWVLLGQVRPRVFDTADQEERANRGVIPKFEGSLDLGPAGIAYATGIIGFLKKEKNKMGNQSIMFVKKR